MIRLALACGASAAFAVLCTAAALAVDPSVTIPDDADDLACTLERALRLAPIATWVEDDAAVCDSTPEGPTPP